MLTITDTLLRRALWATTLFNLGGAALFAWPDQGFGPLLGLPPDVPLVYRAFASLFVLLYAGMYAWLAQQSPIPRAFVAFAAIGKTSAFLLASALWLGGALPLMAVLGFSGDLLFALLFMLWLREPRA